jgi:arginyl-tRNA synthetase
VLEEWAAKKGNTGPYQLYAHTRIRSMLRETPEPKEGKGPQLRSVLLFALCCSFARLSSWLCAVACSCTF